MSDRNGGGDRNGAGGENEKSTTRLFIGVAGLSEKDVNDLFGPFGAIADVNCLDQYSFVQMQNSDDAEKAKKELDGTTTAGGKTLSLEFSRNKGARKAMVCYNCGRPGHFARACPAPRGTRDAQRRGGYTPRSRSRSPPRRRDDYPPRRRADDYPPPRRSRSRSPPRRGAPSRGYSPPPRRGYSPPRSRAPPSRGYSPPPSYRGRSPPRSYGSPPRSRAYSPPPSRGYRSPPRSRAYSPPPSRSYGSPPRSSYGGSRGGPPSPSYRR